VDGGALKGHFKRASVDQVLADGVA
jgi:hypothetical protein